MSIKNITKKYMPNLYKTACNLKYEYFFYQCFKILKKIDSIIPTSKIEDKRIVFNLIRSYAIGPLFFESSLAIKLREYGVKVNVLIDDGILRTHDTIQYDTFIENKNLISPKMKITNNFLKKISLYKLYSEFIEVDELKNVKTSSELLIRENNFYYNNINLKPYIEASVIRFFQLAEDFPERGEAEYSKILKICTENAIISTLIASKVEELLHPEIIVTSHGIYSTWGPFYEYFKKKGKKVIAYGFSNFINNGVVFSKIGIIANKIDDRFFDIHKNKIDLKLAKKNIETIFNKRFIGKSIDLIQNNFVLNNNILKNIKNVTQEKDAFALFPNVLWDASLTDTKSIFNSQVEWIIETIKYFEKQDNKVLIIRAHPSESKHMRSRIGVKEIIESKIKLHIKDPTGNYLLFFPRLRSLTSSIWYFALTIIFPLPVV